MSYRLTFFSNFIGCPLDSSSLAFSDALARGQHGMIDVPEP